MSVVKCAMHYDANIYLPLVHYRQLELIYVQQQNLECSVINVFI
jgi:hypothetical protein